MKEKFGHGVEQLLAVLEADATASSSSVDPESPQQKMMSHARKICSAIQKMIWAYRKKLTQILHKEWIPVHELPKDEDLDDLFLESQIAIEKALASMRDLKPEEMTTECMLTMKTILIALVELSSKAKIRLDNLIRTLSDQDEASARILIQLSLGKIN
ncbi:hypothetical protein SAY87_002961 [Trapa incisa]|uniref:Uncharacterized protein n=1 Tax=Trapa incisa TaxID=236973 RepID=A0AAN7KJS7_9MYRT|nr:hypothetical protein SAY87_002961 [Trapa incisa]